MSMYLDIYNRLRVSYQSIDQLGVDLVKYSFELHKDLLSILKILNKDKDGSYFICEENNELIEYLLDKYKL